MGSRGQAVEGVHFVRSVRAGKPVKWYVYAWRGGPCIMKAEGPDRPRLGRAEQEALGAAVASANLPRDDGLLSGLIRRWRGLTLETASPEWKSLAPSTRETWGYSLDAIERKWGATPLGIWNDARMVRKVIDWRDSRSDRPRAADMGVQVLGELLAFGKLRQLVTINVAAEVPALGQTTDRAAIIWTEEDIEHFSLSAIVMNRPHVIDGLWLACLTGMRRADLVGLTWGEVTDHAIVRTARKKSRGRRRRAVVPLIRETRHLLDELRTRHREPGVDHVLVNSLGKPWTPESFTKAFNRVRDAARGGEGIRQPADEDLGQPATAKHLHDARGTFITKLCRTDLTNDEIARITAWSASNVETIRRTYVDDAAVVVALSERIRRAL